MVALHWQLLAEGGEIVYTGHLPLVCCLWSADFAGDLNKNEIEVPAVLAINIHGSRISGDGGPELFLCE